MLQYHDIDDDDDGDDYIGSDRTEISLRVNESAVHRPFLL